MNRVFLAALLGALLATSACKAKPDANEAIRAGVVKYLISLKGLNIPNMNIKLMKVSIDGNHAHAEVEIRAKNDSAGMMQLSYVLEKRGEEWVVLKSQPAGGNLQRPAGGEMPGAEGMPPGHPAVGGAAGGHAHPDLDEIMKTAPPPGQHPPATATTKPQTKP
jgi:hypothetical protein